MEAEVLVHARADFLLNVLLLRVICVCPFLFLDHPAISPRLTLIIMTCSRHCGCCYPHAQNMYL